MEQKTNLENLINVDWIIESILLSETKFQDMYGEIFGIDKKDIKTCEIKQAEAVCSNSMGSIIISDGINSSLRRYIIKSYTDNPYVQLKLSNIDGDNVQFIKDDICKADEIVYFRDIDLKKEFERNPNIINAFITILQMASINKTLLTDNKQPYLTLFLSNIIKGLFGKDKFTDVYCGNISRTKDKSYRWHITIGNDGYMLAFDKCGFLLAKSGSKDTNEGVYIILAVFVYLIIYEGLNTKGEPFDIYD